MSVSIDAYRMINVGTAHPREVVVRLFDAATRFLAEAESALSAEEPPEEALAKAREIVTALMSSLNFEAGEMAQNLLRLYLFVLGRIQEARIEGRGRALAEARRVLETLKTGFEEMSPAEARHATPDRASAARVNLQG